MRLFYSYFLFFLLSLPFIYWYIRQNGKFTDLFTVPRFISFLSLGYMFTTVALYIWVPTYREHIEPSITTISLMIADGYPAYTEFSDSNVYSLEDIRKKGWSHHYCIQDLETLFGKYNFFTIDFELINNNKTGLWVLKQQ